VIVTHERPLAERYAARMIFLADGKVDEQASPRPATSITPEVQR
jgi:ABC-type histidine transport system ATPase subunit